MTGRSPGGRTGLRIVAEVFFVRFILRSIVFLPPLISECFIEKFSTLFLEIPLSCLPACRPVQHSSRCTRRRRGRDAPVCRVRATGGAPGRPGGVSRFYYPAKILVGLLFIIRYDTYAFQTTRPAGPNHNGFTSFEFWFNIYIHCKIFHSPKSLAVQIVFYTFRCKFFIFHFFFYLRFN